MARFCYFFRLSPDEFWNLDMDEYFALLRLMRRVDAQHEANRPRRRRR